MGRGALLVNLQPSLRDSIIFDVVPRTSVLGLEFYIFQSLGSAWLPAGVIFYSRLQLELCQPRTFSPGKRVFKPARTLYLSTTGL